MRSPLSAPTFVWRVTVGRGGGHLKHLPFQSLNVKLETWDTASVTFPGRTPRPVTRWEKRGSPNFHARTSPGGSAHAGRLVTSHVIGCPTESVLTALSRGTRAIRLQLQLPPLLRAALRPPSPWPRLRAGAPAGRTLSRLFLADRVLPEPSVPTPQPRSAWSWTRMTRRS